MNQFLQYNLTGISIYKTDLGACQVFERELKNVSQVAGKRNLNRLFDNAEKSLQ